jgi:hypothetical protein
MEMEKAKEYELVFVYKNGKTYVRKQGVTNIRNGIDSIF